jgi:tricorn protease
MTRHVLSIVLVASASLCVAADAPLLLQKPAVNKTHVAFVYAGDLWTVPRDGGDAVRLTTATGVETDPVYSPDGSKIAFTGEYDGNVDVYVVAATGGVPQRLTWHPAPDGVLGWTPDGNAILFSSPRTSYSRFNELFTVPVAGGFEEKLPLPTGFEGAYSPDGKSLAYVPIRRSFTVWKRYRGGTTTRVWLASLGTSKVEKVPRENSNDFNPMWVGDKVYFLSDRGGPVTLFAYDPKAKSVKEVLANKGLDLKSASAGPDVIAYEQFGSIHLLDVKSGKSKPVPIRVSGDFPELRSRLVNVGKQLGSPAISPTGARALFTGRGEVITVPAEKGDARVITNTPGVMEREPQWSPDGKTIAYFSDESSEYALHLKPQTGTGDTTKIALEGVSFPLAVRWSPDSKKIGFVDNHLHVWYVDLDTKKLTKIDKDVYYPGGYDLAPVWSPDSKWIAYAKRLKNHFRAIHFYSIADGKSTQITDGMSDARHPVFDKEGKYLYFTVSTDIGASLQPDLHSFSRPATRSVYLVVLDKSLPSPFAPESDDEKVAEEKKAEEKKPDEAKPVEEAKKPDAAKPKPEAAKPVNVKIDLDGIDQRILAVPMPPRRYVSLQVAKAGVLLAPEAPLPGPAAGPGPAEPPGMMVHRFDLKSRKSDVPLSGVRTFIMSHNGEKALYRQGDNWTIAALRPMPTGSGPAPPTPPAGGPGGPSQNNLKVDPIEVRVEPREEWKQMYREAWRIERDFFYDPNMHGLDLKAAAKKYEPYLENIASRRDLTYLFQEMLGEMTVGHLGTGGGDVPEPKRVQTGLLGCDYEIANGRYRFARVYNGENWNPQMRAPLTQPGVNVKAGEYLLAVNGRELRAPAENVFSFFEGLANKSVVLKVGPDPSGANSREVTVVPVPNDSGLRNLAWIEENRRKVDQMTNGRVAYIYMPDTAFGGITNFNRYFYAQIGKEAAIIDERYNAGGALATDITEILSRKLLSAVRTRSGEDEMQPQGAIFGPKIMIINETAGSGGDAMPWYFRRAGVGKLVGTRTWGGLVGRAGAPQLMDGGFVSAPGSGVFNPLSGEWEVENIGVAPDLEVEQDPELVRQGKDPQLEKAVQIVMEELKKNPPPQLRRPKFPNYHTKEVRSESRAPRTSTAAAAQNE